jgi:hypothetical protein
MRHVSKITFKKLDATDRFDDVNEFLLERHEHVLDEHVALEEESSTTESAK